MKLPDIELPSTLGGTVNPSKLKGRAVIFCYPYTGRPGIPDPEGWDHIPGAHGSTPQAKAYAALYPEFVVRGISVYGLSLQDTAWQKEFAGRCEIPFPLLSDTERTLGLETFKAGPRDFLRRVTLIVEDGSIIARRYPTNPEKDASEILPFIRAANAGEVAREARRRGAVRPGGGGVR
jgi:peroxiredoxin